MSKSCATAKKAVQHNTIDETSVGSAATVFNDLIFTTQTPLNADGSLPDGISAQSHQVLANLETVLELAGSSMDRVLQLTIYLVDLQHRAIFNAAYSAHFSAPLPARAAIGVAGLARPGMLVEVSAVAAG